MENNQNLGKSLDELVPNKIWFTLKEACELKNLNYKTSCNRTWLQPRKGQADRTIGGKKVWARSTILEWVVQTDEDIKVE